MSLNKNYIGKKYQQTTHSVTNKQIRDYASAIGSSNKLYFNSDGSNAVMAPPGFQVVYEMPALQDIWAEPALHGGKQQADENVLMLVHGEQSMTFYNMVKSGDTLSLDYTLADIIDKSSGQFLKFNISSNNQHGLKVTDSDWSLFIRNVSPDAGKSMQAKPPVKNPESRNDLVFRKLIRTTPETVSTYSQVSNDKNPIHIDHDEAVKAGFKGVILHGLCTMAMGVNAIVDFCLSGDPTLLKKVSVRFSAPVYPGDVLIADGWVSEQDGDVTTLGFELVRRDDGVRVLSNGVAVVSTQL